ncbi:hypothetical protein LguiA_013921 [Lonicera macranthoides]
MEAAVLGFKEEPTSELMVEDKSCGYKWVPWISWDDWNFVRDSLFSSSPKSISLALRRILAWRSRGCVPVVIDVTASIIEIQQKDPFFRNDMSDDPLHSEEMLAMLYCMAIMRLVNGLVEKTRKKNEVSIGEAADAIGIPRMLIDIRHEGSHRDLPSIRLVRLASVKALDWLKCYYWEPQKMAIPSDRTANIRKEIKSMLRELAFSLKIKQTSRSSSSIVKGKQLFGFSLVEMARREIVEYSKTSLPPIFIIIRLCLSMWMLTSSKSMARLCNSVLYLIIRITFEKLDITPHLYVILQDSRVKGVKSNIMKTGDSDEWKLIVIKLSNKEPELLLTLLKAVLDMIETREAANYEFGGYASGPQQLAPEYGTEFRKMDQLSYLLEWLAGNLAGLEETKTKDSSTELNMPKATLIQLLHKCLLVSCPNNSKLTSTALILARIIGNNTLVEKLNKLAILLSSNVDINEENSNLSLLSLESFLSKQDDSIRRAAAELDFVKLQLIKKNNVNTSSQSEGSKRRWVVAKSWNACPIGMLPRDVGSSGRLPVLECNEDTEKAVKLLEREDDSELDKCSGKREAEYGIEALDCSGVKKMKESEVGGEMNDEGEKSAKGVEGQLMIGGVLRKICEEEVFAIASAVRVLV